MSDLADNVVKAVRDTKPEQVCRFVHQINVMVQVLDSMEVPQETSKKDVSYSHLCKGSIQQHSRTH